MIEEYHITYAVNGKYVDFDIDPKIPFMLADQIKEVIRKYYKEGEK